MHPGWSALQNFTFARSYGDRVQIAGQYVFMMSANSIYCHDLEDGAEIAMVISTALNDDFTVVKNGTRYTCTYGKQSGGRLYYVYSTDLINWSAEIEVPTTAGTGSFNVGVGSIGNQLYGIATNGTNSYSYYSDKEGDMKSTVQLEWLAASYDAEI